MPAIDCDIPNLYEQLPRLLSQVPRGRVTTYGDLAKALGDVAAARWVGEFMVDHEHTDDCRCHRVIRKTGELGLYITGNTDRKRRALQRESVEVTGGQVDLKQFGFNAFTSPKPLIALSEFQDRIPEFVSLKPFRTTPRLIAGVDVAYPQPDRAVAAYVVVDVASGRSVWSTTLSRRVTFPYIPGYLAFRELPVLLDLLEHVKSQQPLAELILVDGNGILHPRRAGIATHLGVATETPTIGIGKSLLCGQVNSTGMTAGDSRPVTYDGRIVGMVLKAKETSRPIYVSPGHKIDVADGVRIARLLFQGHRLPEPVFQADGLSRRAAVEIASG